MYFHNINEIKRNLVKILQFKKKAHNYINDKNNVNCLT